jgi:hypothetical protein
VFEVSLTQVAPFLPPRREGVGGYAISLARRLRGNGIDTEFLLPEPTASSIEGFAARRLEPTRLRGRVLFHYSNYGYDPNGCPGELVDSLVAARAGGQISTLTVFFHEVYASSPPWRRAFWFGRRQRSLAAALASCADHALTSIDLYAELLRDLGAHEPVEVMAIPSTVGEPKIVPPVNDRAPKLVVFGGAGNRSKVYGQAPAGIAGLLRDAGIDEIVDIGPESDAMPSEAGGIPVTRRGVLADEEVSRELLSARLGALAYPPEFFGKSTVFAAFAAHGVPCLALSRQHYEHVAPPHVNLSDPLTDEKLSQTAIEALAWSRMHGIEAHAKLIKSWLEASP